MTTPQLPPAMKVEATFNTFVEDFGGELISKIFEGHAEKPTNADYFFRDRTIIAELKCLEKDYFRDQKVGEKLSALLRQWAQKGVVQPTAIEEGGYRIANLPDQCRREVIRVVSPPIEKAVTKANRQIRETKRHFHLPEAKGLSSQHIFMRYNRDGFHSWNDLLASRCVSQCLLVPWNSFARAAARVQYGRVVRVRRGKPCGWRGRWTRGCMLCSG